ncbi:MAG TPA: hypothetical protein PLB38_00975 [bacterium]|nr:hypothetical protein [bacterium]
MINWTAPLSVDYWFSSKVLVGPLFWGLLALFGALLISGIVLDILLAMRQIINYRSVVRQFSSFCWTMSLIGFIWLFFFYQGVYILSARVWFLLWLLIAGIWLYFIYNFYKQIKARYLGKR